MIFFAHFIFLTISEAHLILDSGGNKQFIKIRISNEDLNNQKYHKNIRKCTNVN